MIKVLVVDDSLFMRTLISDLLNSDPGIEVIGKARDGETALKEISGTRPDCVTLDLMMPGWDGLTTLRHIMNECPVPVIILSAHSKEDADITIKCLNAGAVGCVLKPSGELSLDIEEVKHQLIEEVKAASRVDVKRIGSLASKRAKRPGRGPIALNKIIVIGASTGGPQTLEAILYPLPANFSVPVVIAQHMPSRFFTESLAGHLDKISELEVRIARDNEAIRGGRAYMAPGGSQTEICDFRFAITPHLNPFPQGEREGRGGKSAIKNTLTPSIDVIMESAVRVYGANTVGIILTGMGHDGLKGMKAIKEAGGKTIVQDKSALIFGMPRAVIEAGYADRILPASRIGEAMIEGVEIGNWK